MAKRLNPQRRKALMAERKAREEHELTVAIRRSLNPSPYSEDVTIRTMGLPKALWGSSKGLSRGLIRQEAGTISPVSGEIVPLRTYAQHKRRKATAKGQVIGTANVPVTFPEQIASPTQAPARKDEKRISQPNKVVLKSKKLWSQTVYDDPVEEAIFRAKLKMI